MTQLLNELTSKANPSDSNFGMQEKILSNLLVVDIVFK